MAFIHYNIANDTTGEIELQIGADLELDPVAVSGNVETGYTAYEGEPYDNPSTAYYVAGVKTTRPALSAVATWDATTVAADGVTLITLGTSLPNPTQVVIQPPPSVGIFTVVDTVTDGSLEFSTTVAGEYLITVTAFPYLTETFTITAT